MPKEQRLRYERLNHTYGAKHGLTPNMTGGIRSGAITYKRTKEVIISLLLDRIHRLENEAGVIEEKLKERRKTVDILLRMTPEEFEGIIAVPKRFQKDE